ncbi:uncharacterized protein LOC124151172 [Haliotis rufescens]|uniref:uncharacterized protein LOC124151172 n=1 Tax=Haliotis rufescens TaxID=6454 RepID=UPI00201F8AE9|nr:uncharacterized protein LOC124151172 [Haliotis rufescens]
MYCQSVGIKQLPVINQGPQKVSRGLPKTRCIIVSSTTRTDLGSWDMAQDSVDMEEEETLPPSGDIEQELVPPGGDVEHEVAAPSVDIEHEVAPPSGDIEQEVVPPGGDVEHEVAPPGGDSEHEVAPPSGDIEHEVAPPSGDMEEEETLPPGGDIEQEVLPPGGDIEQEMVQPGGDIEAEVAPPGEEEYQGLPASRHLVPDAHSAPAIPLVVSEQAEEDTVPNTTQADQTHLVSRLCEEPNSLSIYMRHIIEQEGINVSENLTISTSEGEREAQDEDAEQQPLNLLSQISGGEISLHERTDFNQYHNMRLIMDSTLGQSFIGGQTHPAERLYLMERNFNIEQIVTIWEMPDIYQRDQLLSSFCENSTYRPNIVQRGGYLALLRTLSNLDAVISQMPQELHDAVEGVLLNNQDLLEPSNGHFEYGHEYVCVHQYNQRTLRCRLPNGHFNFIRKTYYFTEWSKEQMIVPFLCGTSVVKPLGLTWGQGKVHVFLPVIEGETLTDLLKRVDRGLTPPEVILLTYELLNILSIFQAHNCLHRNITPDNVIISCSNMRVNLVGLGAMCRQQNALSWIPPNLSLYSAPELARGEDHTGSVDQYSSACIMISALTRRIPFFEVNGTQRTRQNYLFRIGQGLYPPPVDDLGLGLGNCLLRLLKAMIRSEGEILPTYFWNTGRRPRWKNSYFQPSPPTMADITRRLIAVYPQQPNLNIPSEEILSSACEVSEVTEEQETTAVRKYDRGNSQNDSGQFTSTSNEFCTVVVKEDGVEVVTLSLPWNTLTRRVYSQLSEQIKITGKYVLLYNGQIVRFDTLLNDLPQTHLSMPVHLRLRREDRVEEPGPDDSGSRSNQRSGSRTVVEGAAYNGDDHVVYDDSVQACDLPSMAGESDSQCDAPEGDRTQRRVPSTLAFTGAFDGAKTLFVGQADSQRRNRSRGTYTFEDATNDEDDKDDIAATAISHQEYRLDEEDDEGDRLQEEAEEGREEVSPGDNSDVLDEEESPTTDEANDVEHENEACDEDAEGRANSRSTNMERLMSSEEQEDTLSDGAGGSEKDGEDVGRNSEDDESVCGDSQTSSDEIFSEDEEADDEKGGYVAGHPSRNQQRVSVEPEASDFDPDVNVENNVDSEVNVNGSVSHGSDDDEESDSGLTGDAPDSSSFSEVGVTVTNEASTPMSEECGSLEDED